MTSLNILNTKTVVLAGILLFCLSRQSFLRGEIIYLNDGQVLKGSILKENNTSITVRTKYQTRTVKRNNIKRILYGDRDMEKIYILDKKGTLRKGFLVDQNSRYIFFREKKDSVTEERILKSNIKQISREEIILLQPDISYRINIFFPLNSGGSNLAPSPMYTISLGFNFTPVKNIRVIPEAGYVKSISHANKRRYLQMIPVTAGMSCRFSRGNIVLLPKIGIGIAVVDFNNGEGEKYRGYDFYCSAGAGAFYKLNQKSLSLGIWIEYGLLLENSELMHNFIAGTGLSYHF